ncbi:MAG: hypothetical protein F4X63_08195 [Nitrospira sp. SB0662_bin_26]|nr:hypothetical protein [Nitrospira sp. SB0662_bin_26]
MTESNKDKEERLRLLAESQGKQLLESDHRDEQGLLNSEYMIVTGQAPFELVKIYCKDLGEVEAHLNDPD